MCLLVVEYQTVPEAPLLLAANREEFFERPTAPPSIHVPPVPPRMLCGTDLRAGGTWLGVNEHSLVVAVTNRPKSHLPAARSRGTLCRELLQCGTAREASQRAVEQLSTGWYAGANYVCLDAEFGAVIHGGDRIESIPLSPGRHLVTHGDLNDGHEPRLSLARQLFAEHAIASGDDFLAVARLVCASGRIVLRSQDRGTVSSTLIALTTETAAARYLFAPGPPDITPYADYSPQVRELLN